MFYLILGSSILKKARKSLKKKKGKPKRCPLLTTSIQTAEPNQKPELRISIALLPCHILADILSRLPLKTILCCRCVCKEWLNLITCDPDFASLHFSRSNAELMVCPRGHASILKSLYLVDLEVDAAYGFGVRVPIKPKFNLPVPDCIVVNECRGFLCLCENLVNNDPSVVCNPITGEYIMLPRSNEYSLIRSVVVSGFGFSPTTKEFKVLRVCWSGIEVHILGSDCWRSIGHFPYSPFGNFSRPTFFNASIHWVYEDLVNSKSIISFDFGKEGFEEIPLPSHFGENQKKGENTVNIGVIGACLFVGDLVPFGYFDIWVMKEYGLQESWSKDFVIETMVTNVLHNRSFLPVKCLRNGEIVMMCNDDTLVCYDPKNKGLRYIGCCGIHSKFESLITPSFISFKDVVVKDTLEVLKITSRYMEVDLDTGNKALFLKEHTSRSVGSEPQITCWW